MKADVSSKAEVDAMFDAVIAKWGTVDILVNNAGNIYADRHFLTGDEAWWDQVLAVNLKGAFLCSHRAAHIMARKAAAARDHQHVQRRRYQSPPGQRVAYDASKGGIEAMTRAMALDLAPYGIRVNAVVPGFIRTYDLTDEAAVERGKSRRPLGRMGLPEDLAGPTVFLATDDAKYITGICLAVDGGVLVQQRSVPVDTFPPQPLPCSLAVRVGRPPSADCARMLLCDQSRLGGLGVSKYAGKFIQLKRLLNKVRESQPSEHGVDMLLTIGTRENYLHIRRGPMDPV